MDPPPSSKKVKAVPLSGGKKRDRRALGTPVQTPAPAETVPECAQHDILSYFAERGSKAKDLEQQLHCALVRQQQLEEQLRCKDGLVKELQESLRTQTATVAVEVSRKSHEIEVLHSNLRQEYSRSTEINSLLQQALESKIDLQNQLLGTPTNSAALSSHVVSNTASMDNQIKVLSTALEHARHDEEDKLRVLRAEIAGDRAKYHQCVLELEQLRGENQRLRDDLKQEHERRVTLEQTSTELERKLLSHGSVSLTSEKVLVQHLQEENRRLENEVTTARQLSDYMGNVQLLRQQLLEAQQRLELAEQKLQAADIHDDKILQLETELQHWQTALSGICAVSTPEQLLHSFVKLQKDCFSANELAGCKGAELKQALVELNALQRQLNEEQGKCKVCAQEAGNSRMTVARLEKKVELLGEERDSFKRVLDAYEQAACLGVQEEVSGNAQFQKLNDKLSAYIMELEDALRGKDASNVAAMNSVVQAEARASEAERAVQRLETENETLHQEVACLQGRLGRGEYNPEVTRVLHMVRNPESNQQRIALEARLKEKEVEVAAFKEQLQRLEQSATATPQGTVGAVAQAKVAVLEKKVAELEKKLKRLQEVFKQQITNFREACYHLFGYRVDMSASSSKGLAGTTVRLVPAAADNSQVELLFRFKMDGTMEAVPNSYMRKHLSKEMETYIVRFQSIPAFTANLTVELLNRAAT